MDVHLIRAQQACCADLAGEDAYIGATVIHPDGSDKTAHELDVYWRDTPSGRRQVTLLGLDPLTVAEELTCPCGWTGRIGKV